MDILVKFKAMQYEEDMEKQAAPQLQMENYKLPPIFDRNLDFWMPMFFQLTACIIFAYSICMSSQYDISTKQVNPGSFFVEYGLFLAIFWAGQFSGAHLNWAVSLAFYLKKNSGFDHKKLILYVFPEMIGPFLGGMLAWGLQDRVNAPIETATTSAILVQDFFAQIFSTFILVFFVLYTSSDMWPQKYPTLINVLMPIILFIARTFAFRTQCLNPSLALSLGLVYSIKNNAWHFWKNIWVLTCGPIVGAVCAAIFIDRYFSKMEKLQ